MSGDPTHSAAGMARALLTLGAWVQLYEFLTEPGAAPLWKLARDDSFVIYDDDLRDLAVRGYVRIEHGVAVPGSSGWAARLSKFGETQIEKMLAVVPNLTPVSSEDRLGG